MTRHTIRFAESQHFRQWWIWLTMGGTAVFTMGLFAHGLYVQLVQGRPWGNNPMSDTALTITAILVFVFDLALLALFAWAHLRTEVRSDGLYVRFFPFHLSFHRLPLADVAEIEAVTYRPIMDYGGWGIRYSWGSPGGTKGKAYNVRGNRGVRLTYRTSTHLLLGSQQPDTLATAIQALRESGAGR
jgi:hypothetical protein